MKRKRCHRHKPRPCHSCGRIADATTSHNDKPPNQGDVSICISCGAIGIWDQGAIREPSAAETVEIMASHLGDEIRAAQILIADRGPLPPP